MSELEEAGIGLRLDVLRLGYLERLPEKLQAIASIWERVRGNRERGSAEEELRRALHMLAGTAATFGCPGVADIARRFEGLLKEAAAVAWEGSALFYRQGTSYLQWLEEAAAMEQTAYHPVAAETSAKGQPLAAGLEYGAVPPKSHAADEPCSLYLLDDDAEFAASLAATLKNRGYLIEAFLDVPAFESALSATTR